MIVGITCGGPDLPARMRDALAAGLDVLLVREDALPAGLDALAEAWPGRVALHTRMPGAEALAARLPVALHVASTVPVEAWPASAFSVSAHTPEEVRRARAAGASWAFLSPIWRSPSKPGDTRPALGVAVLREPGAVALGGVSLARVALCRAAGAHGVAGMGGLFGARDVAEAVGAWRNAWRDAGPVQNDQTSSS
jgi:thiamine-phosphate pyrophosphorylase